MTSWIDTHCHLDAPELAPDRLAVRQRAWTAGVAHCVIPAVEPANFAAVTALAHHFGDSYALGIHPLCVERADETHLTVLDAALAAQAADPRLVAVGEIGLDFFVPALKQGLPLQRQEHFYREQLKLARAHGLPVILHVRRSADRLLKFLRALAPAGGWLGIAHAFNGSEQQAQAFIELGFKLGVGGVVTFEPARQLRHLVSTLPLQALVLETDAPDIPPWWLYKTASERQQGQAQGRNEPAELVRIAAAVARLRGISTDELARACLENALAALPRLRRLLPSPDAAAPPMPGLL